MVKAGIDEAGGETAVVLNEFQKMIDGHSLGFVFVELVTSEDTSDESQATSLVQKRHGVRSPILHVAASGLVDRLDFPHSRQ